MYQFPNWTFLFLVNLTKVIVEKAGLIQRFSTPSILHRKIFNLVQLCLRLQYQRTKISLTLDNGFIIWLDFQSQISVSVVTIPFQKYTWWSREPNRLGSTRTLSSSVTYDTVAFIYFSSSVYICCKTHSFVVSNASRHCWAPSRRDLCFVSVTSWTTTTVYAANML